MSSIITLPNGNAYTLVSLPSSPGLSQVEFTMRDTVTVVSSPFVPSQAQTQSWPGADAWSLTVTLPKMTRATAAPWRGFFAGLQGMQNVFQIGDPFATTPQGAADGAPITLNTNLASATSVNTTGWTQSIYGQLLAGDYIQIGYRLHQVREDVNSDANGNATISIWPSLREAPAPGTQIVLMSPVGLFRLASNARTWHADFTGLVQLSFRAVEVR